VTAFVSWLRAEWDRAVGVGFLLAGAVSLTVGYAGVADASYVPQALSFIASGGFFGFLLIVVGATLIVTAALHDQWRKLDLIEQAIDRLGLTLTAGSAGGHGTNGTDTDLVAVADGLSRWHRPGCATLTGQSVRLVARAEATGSALAPCGLCDPTGA
jgi:hypothetical protein